MRRRALLVAGRVPLQMGPTHTRSFSTWLLTLSGGKGRIQRHGGLVRRTQRSSATSLRAQATTHRASGFATQVCSTFAPTPLRHCETLVSSTHPTPLPSATVSHRRSVRTSLMMLTHGSRDARCQHAWNSRSVANEIIPFHSWSPARLGCVAEVSISCRPAEGALLRLCPFPLGLCT